MNFFHTGGPNYTLLGQHLARQRAKNVVLTFSEIEQIISAPLPKSAEKYPEWWNAAGHSHAQTWEKSGYKAVQVKANMLNKRMAFERQNEPLVYKN